MWGLRALPGHKITPGFFSLSLFHSSFPDSNAERGGDHKKTSMRYDDDVIDTLSVVKEGIKKRNKHQVGVT